MDEKVQVKAKKPSILKAVCIGMSAYIVRSAIAVSLGMGIENEFVVALLSNLAIIIIGGLYYNYCIEPLGNRVRMFDNKKLPLAVLGSVTAIAILGILLMGWFTHNGLFQNNPGTALLEVNLGFYFTYAILIVPIAEEIMYRGFFFRHLYAVNKPAAYCISVLFFAVSHGTPVQMIVAAFGGVLYAMVYTKTKSLRFCITAHALYNALAVLFMLIANATGLSNPNNPEIIYNVAWVVIFALITVSTFILLHFAPAGITVARPKTLTPEEKADKERKQAEWQRIHREIEEETALERELEKQARK
jgi:hypothetical protein